MLKNNRMKVISLVMLIVGLAVVLVVGIIKDVHGVETVSSGFKFALQCYSSITGVFIAKSFFFDKDQQEA